MRGDAEVIRHLNAVLTNELTAINQYFLHSRMFRHWGLAAARRARAPRVDRRDEARGQADRAHPVPRGPAEPAGPAQAPDRRERAGSARAATSSSSMAAHPALKAAIAHCETVGDYVSRELFEDILESEEEHIDFLETQLELIGGGRASRTTCSRRWAKARRSASSAGPPEGTGQPPVAQRRRTQVRASVGGPSSAVQRRRRGQRPLRRGGSRATR